MVLDKVVKMKIGKKQYNLSFPISTIFELEEEMDQGLMKVIARIQEAKIKDIYTLFKWAVIGGGHELTEEEIQALFLEAVDEAGYETLVTNILNAVVKSGIIGSQKKINAVLTSKKE